MIIDHPGRLISEPSCSLSGRGINTITRCERGSLAVTLDTLDRLAESLRCDSVVAAEPACPMALPAQRRRTPSRSSGRQCTDP
jgi:hypothetical protein